MEAKISVKATVENPRGSVKKLSPKESVKGGDTGLRGSVRAYTVRADYPHQCE